MFPRSKQPYLQEGLTGQGGDRKVSEPFHQPRAKQGDQVLVVPKHGVLALALPLMGVLAQGCWVLGPGQILVPIGA